MDKVLVAIPAYRCEKQIGRVLKNLSDADDLRALVHRIVVIDNRSTDETASAAQAAIAECRVDDIAFVVKNDDNYGLGGSHKSALKIATELGCDWIMILHGDDQGIGTEGLAKIRSLKTSTAREVSPLDACLGSRFSFRSTRTGYAIERVLGNLVLNIVYTVLTGRMISDLGSGLNLFRTSALRSIPMERCSNGFTFNMELLLNLIRGGCRTAYFPITWREVDQVSNVRNVSVAWTAFKTAFRWRFDRKWAGSCEPRAIETYTSTRLIGSSTQVYRP